MKTLRSSLALLLALAILEAGVVATRTIAAEGDARPSESKGEGRGEGRGNGGNPANRIQFILKRGSDLNLTPEQISKLEELARDAESNPASAAGAKEKIDAILTDEQRAKQKEFFKSRRSDAIAAAIDLPPPPVIAPRAPQAEDNVKPADLLTFTLNHTADLFLRKDQREQLQALAAPAAPAAPGTAMDGETKKRIWEILTGQQIGKLRVLLHDAADPAPIPTPAATSAPAVAPDAVAVPPAK